MYLFHIQHIQHLEPADMCTRLELCHWINSNPHTVWFARFIHHQDPHKMNTRDGLIQRILSTTRSINNTAVLYKFTSSLVTFVRKGIQVDGGHFEQLV